MQRRVSKLLSFVLRHNPQHIGLTLDYNGWCSTQELIDKINSAGLHTNIDMLKDIVNTNNKQRFTFNADKSKIRANQGHSIDVELDLKECVPPDILYHGTSSLSVFSIIKEGIHKRQRHHVHLSADKQTALSVGKRHSNLPAILSIDAKQMVADEVKFFLSKNNVWLTDYISPKYIELLKIC